MAEYKLVISDPKTGKAYSSAVGGSQADSLIGLKLGDSLKGDKVGLGGYELKVAGGSDSSGFPMRQGYHGMASRRLLLSGGIGFNPERRGERARKRVCGDTVNERTAQLNLVVETAGPKRLDDLLKKEESEEAKK